MGWLNCLRSDSYSSTDCRLHRNLINSTRRQGGVAITQTSVKMHTETFDIIVDGADSAVFSTSGAWTQSKSSAGFYGAGYKTAPAGTGTLKAKWTLTLPTIGSYEIFCFYTAYSNRAKNAPYSQANNGAVIGAKQVDQTINGRVFFSLGTYTLSKGTLEITLSNAGNGYIIADAVKATFKP